MTIAEIIAPMIADAMAHRIHHSTVDAMLIAEGFVNANGQPDIVAAFCACPRCKQDSWALCRCHDDDLKMTWEPA